MESSEDGAGIQVLVRWRNECEKPIHHPGEYVSLAIGNLSVVLGRELGLPVNKGDTNMKIIADATVLSYETVWIRLEGPEWNPNI